MSREAAVDKNYDWLWAIFSTANVELAKTMCPADFNWASLDPVHGRTALQVLIYPLLTREVDQAVFDMATWMIDQGADPTLKAAAKDENEDDSDDDEENGNDDGNEDHFWKEGFEDKKDLWVGAQYAGKSSIATVIFLVETMWEKTSKDSDKIDWSDDIQNLNKLLSIFSGGGARTSCKKIKVSSGVVDLWELMCQDSSSHDVTVHAHDGPVTAHAAVLAKASPVLAAMLATEMSEGQKRRIDVKDASAESVKLLFSLMYTGSTTMEFEHSVALAALDLAHRWQAMLVVGMLENALAEMISDGNFSSIAEAAQLKGLASLSKACKRFGSSSVVVQELLKTRTLPKPVLELIGASSEDPKPSKKRRTW